VPRAEAAFVMWRIGHRSGGCGSCGVPLLSQACDLGSVRYIANDGVLRLSVFKVRGAIPERVQTTLATRSGSETKGQVRGPDEFSAPTTLARHLHCGRPRRQCHCRGAPWCHGRRLVRQYVDQARFCATPKAPNSLSASSLLPMATGSRRCSHRVRPEHNAV
jgi:hypothetical protein